MFNFTSSSGYELAKSFLFKLDPEKAHHLTIKMMSSCPSILAPNPNLGADPRLELKVCGLNWSGPVGLAAGLDKDAQAASYLARLPFGALEVGTVTPRPQIGNPKPRLWRYPDEAGLRNQMGFNNLGADEMRKAIQNADLNHKVLGINFGKNKDTPADKAGEDYGILYDKLADLADYVVINVSSPNTPGLRDLQSEDGLRLILDGLRAARAKLQRPIFVKVAPDITHEGLDGVVKIALEYQVDGLIATNTTHIPSYGPGGVSGGPLKYKAADVREYLLTKMSGTGLELIGVGGFSSLSDIWQYWLKGGRAVQVYTSFIYQGPPLLYSIANELSQILDKHGLRDLEEMLENIHELPLPVAH